MPFRKQCNGTTKTNERVQKNLSILKKILKKKQVHKYSGLYKKIMQTW